MWSHHTNLTWPNGNVVQFRGQALSRDRFDMGMSSWIVPLEVLEANCTWVLLYSSRVLGIVAILVAAVWSIILVEQCVNLWTKAASPFGKRMRLSFCSIYSKNSMKVAKRAKDFDIPTATVTMAKSVCKPVIPLASMPCITFCIVCFYQPAFCRVCVFILWTSCLLINK